MIPNFRAMTDEELFAFAQSGHELAAVANYVLELRNELFYYQHVAPDTEARD